MHCCLNCYTNNFAIFNAYKKIEYRYKNIVPSFDSNISNNRKGRCKIKDRPRKLEKLMLEAAKCGLFLLFSRQVS